MPSASTPLPARVALLLPARLLLGLLAGLAWWLAFPSHGLFVLAPVGCALLSAAVLGARAGAAALVGALAGLAFFLPTLHWSGIFVGALPWVALAVLQTLYVVAMTVLCAVIGRRLLLRGWAAAAYLVLPLGWVVQELARGRTPFGGFPWARLAFSQDDSPLLSLARWGGAPLVTFAVAALGALLHAAVVGGVRPGSSRLRYAVTAGLLACALVGGAALIPLPTDGPPARIGLVQGNVPRPGLDFNAERRKVLDNHRDETRVLARRSPDLDLVVWPENSSDIDPLRNPDAGDVIADVVRAAGAPVLVGAVLEEPRPEVSNASLLFRSAHGVPERYVKQHPVPFAEYIPYRSFFRHFSPLVDRVTDFHAGRHDGAFRIRSARPGTGDFWALPTICFEVAYDDLVRSTVTQPGRTPSVLVVQTNNATFGYSAESAQQFAISRLRAVEHGRTVVHVSTVGISGAILPDGSAPRVSRLFTPWSDAVAVPVRDEITPADRLADAPTMLAVALLLGLAVVSLTAPRAHGRLGSGNHRRSAGPSTHEGPPSGD